MPNKSHPVHVIEASDLKQNGGNFRLRAGPAVKVIGNTDTENVAQGKLQAVYIVPDGFPIQGGEPMPVTNAIEVADRGLRGGLIATPVYVVNGDEWPITYYIRDEFTDTRAVGSVDGTDSTPGPGVRNVFDDTDETISVDSGVLSWGLWSTINPWIRWDSPLGTALPISRSPGVTLHFRARHTITAGNAQWSIWLDDATTEPVTTAGQVHFRSQGAGAPTRFICGDLNNTDLSDTFPALGTWGEYAAVLKTVGAILYKWNGSAWNKIVERSDGNSDTLHLAWANFSNGNFDSQGEFDFIRITNIPPSGIPIPS